MRAGHVFGAKPGSTLRARLRMSRVAETARTSVSAICAATSRSRSRARKGAAVVARRARPPVRAASRAASAG